MVVGGLPTPCDNHAERVLNMALGMMEASMKVISPADKLPLKVLNEGKEFYKEPVRKSFENALVYTN